MFLLGLWSQGENKEDLAKSGVSGHLQSSAPIALWSGWTYSLGHIILINHQSLLTQTKLFIWEQDQKIFWASKAHNIYRLKDQNGVIFVYQKQNTAVTSTIREKVRKILKKSLLQKYFWQ